MSVTQLKFSNDAMKLTQQSCVESERVSSKICVNLTTIRLKLNKTMLIDRFPFQNSLSLLLKHTKCTLNLRSHGSVLLPILAAKKTVIKASRANLFSQARIPS